LSILDRLNDLDLALLRYVHKSLWGTPVGAVLYAIQAAGDGRGMVTLLGISVVLAPRGARKRVGVRLVLSVLIASALCAVLKKAIHEPRPGTFVPDSVAWDEDVTLARHGNNSWPSGHTTAAFAFAVGVCALGAPRRAKAAALLVASLTALGRVAVGDHYPGDVLSAALLGGGCAWLLGKAFDRYEARATDPPAGSSEPAKNELQAASPGDEHARASVA
jgi:membrane-associated phospholipid phosphatase